jgi:hypothetical protein
MSGNPSRVQAYLKKREARNALPMFVTGIWAGSFLMALYSDTLLVPGGLGRGGKGNLAFIIVLAIFYLWRKSVLTKQMEELLKSFTPEDKELLLRDIVEQVN